MNTPTKTASRRSLKIAKNDESLAVFPTKTEEATITARAMASSDISSQSSPMLPIPVQTFPVTDDFRFENEKQEAAALAETLFGDYEQTFLAALTKASKEIHGHTQQFFSFTEKACNLSGSKRNSAVKQALEELLSCSPKKILAEFQKQALMAGWSYVSIFNSIIDRFAEVFPRCRAGIYAARLKYSDVIQISDEITATIRSCSTLIDDLQRRFDLLESLQNNIQADVKTPELQTIMDAMKETFADNARYGSTKRSGESWFDRLKRKLTGTVMQPVTAIGDLTSLPALQVQGQMQRTRRMSVFLETSQMFSDGWDEWDEASKSIIFPNLKVMFALKRDYFRNQIICLCDLISYNGNDLSNLKDKLVGEPAKQIAPVKIQKAIANKKTVQSGRKSTTTTKKRSSSSRSSKTAPATKATRKAKK